LAEGRNIRYEHIWSAYWLKTGPDAAAQRDSAVGVAATNPVAVYAVRAG